MEITEIFWIAFAILSVLSFVVPAMRKKMLERKRLDKLKALEEKRGSRAITLIHRQETFALLGIPLVRYIDIEDSEKVLRAIRMTDPEIPIDLIVHTPGGLVLAAEQIAYALCAHEGAVNVIVPHYAMSGGTLIALAADEIVMDENGVLGPVDPQVQQLPAASILKAVSKKDVNEIDDETLIMADIGEKAIRQVKKTVVRIVRDRMKESRAEDLAETLVGGRWPHDYPITVEEAEDLGLPVRTEVPEEVYELMELYAQTSQRRPSVQYVPMPRREDEGAEDSAGNEGRSIRMR
ncbi:MAG: SDH family Clp fold serine proteinase [Anaerolineae bacterium]